MKEKRAKIIMLDTKEEKEILLNKEKGYFLLEGKKYEEIK